MTNEERDKTIEFLLHNQAKHDAHIQELHETVQELAKSSQRHDSVIRAIEDAITRLTHIIADRDEQAEIDRRETRQAITTILTIAESMQKTAQDLISVQHGTSQRVSRLETSIEGHAKRLDDLEGKEVA